MRGLTTDLPLLLPVLVSFVVAAVLLARPLSRRLYTREVVAFLLVASIGLIVATTLTPHVASSSGEGVVGGTCDLSRIGVIPVGMLWRPTEASLNVLLFIPLGLSVGLMPQVRVRTWLIVAALASPFVIEATQSSVTVLRRGCESADVFDNVTGVIIGLAVGLGARALGRRLRLTMDRGIP